MRKAFTLVEILIVVSILGILAAIVLPEFQSHTLQAAEAAAKDNLRILRQQIGLYVVQHDDVAPGYPGNNPALMSMEAYFKLGMIRDNYITDMPDNSFNDLRTIKMIQNNESMPAAATGEYGWIYKPASRDIRLDWPGSDSDGNSYYDY